MPEGQELEHRLTKIESLQESVVSKLEKDTQFKERLDDKLDDIVIKIEGLRYYEKTIEKMENQVQDHEGKILKLYTYFKIVVGLAILASGGSGALIKLLLP